MGVVEKREEVTKGKGEIRSEVQNVTGIVADAPITDSQEVLLQ